MSAPGRVSLPPAASGCESTPATFMVTAYMVGWYGTGTSPLLIFPFATAAGGIAQGAAELWAYKAREGLRIHSRIAGSFPGAVTGPLPICTSPDSAAGPSRFHGYAVPT